MTTRGDREALPDGVEPYDWALTQLRVPEAHAVTRGSPEVIVAVIDLGYAHHPDLDGHLWRNPEPGALDLHGWDCADDDASLEYHGPGDSAYYRGHHVFVAGEVAAVAPECPIMVVRVAYGRPDSWWKGIRYAAEHGARVLSARDPDPLPGGRICLWTRDNGIVTSRVKIYAEREVLPREPIPRVRVRSDAPAGDPGSRMSHDFERSLCGWKTRDGAEAFLSLRLLVDNHRWDQYWSSTKSAA